MPTAMNTQLSELLNQKKTLIFSFGSNSTAQLCARVNNNHLMAFPAHISHWRRIFTNYSEKWGGSGATIIPNKDSITYGSVTGLSDNEIQLLDQFEIGYERQTVRAIIYCTADETIEIDAVAYVAVNNLWTVLPSEAYLTAIHLNMTSQFQQLNPAVCNGIEIWGRMEGNDRNSRILVHISTWNHPGTHALQLPALCIEMNALREEKLTMPRSIGQILEDLVQLGVYSSAQLAAWLTARRLLFHPSTSHAADETINSASQYLTSQEREKMTYLNETDMVLFAHLLRIDG